MKKIDPVVIKETVYVSVWTVILSLLMHGVFIILYNCFPETFVEPYYTVILGNILGAAVAIFNFFLMGLTVQKAVTKEDPKDSKNLMRVSMALRYVLLIVAGVLGAVLQPFNVFSTLIPLMFPRIALIFRSFSLKKGGKQNGTEPKSDQNSEIQDN